jgi:hypothetical protein
MAGLARGYLSMSRSFAHLGWPPVYIGEMALAAVLLLRPAALLWPWLDALLRPSLLSGTGWSMAVFLLFGVLQGLRGLDAERHPLLTAQNVVFHVYPLFFFVGVWAGRRHPRTLADLVRLLAWWHGIYGVAYIVVLNRLFEPEDLSPAGVSVFGQPYGAAVVLLGLLSFEKKLGRVWLPLLLNSFVFLAMQVRAAWLGLALCLPLWASLSGRLGQLTRLGTVLVGLLGVGLLLDVRIPAPRGRGGEIAPRELFARALAAVSPEAAAAINPNADFYAGTVSWRTSWWRAIWKMVHDEPLWVVVGPGYGYPLWELHPEEDLSDHPIRTPHNVFLYALGYSGWLGVALFYGLLLTLGRLLWLTYRRTGQPFGLCYWMMVVIWGHFDNFFETPFGAIPFYLLIGLSVSPLFSTRSARIDGIEDGSCSEDQGGRR